jgi:polysaccharide deacetylase family protein (PEP-CTERM system associated)
VKNALTVDVEDWFQVSNFASLIKKCEWDSLPSHVESNTLRLLDLFDEHDASATFFVLGWVAERFPGLIGEIRARGHDIGCHGYGHDLVYDLGRAEFASDLDRAVTVIEAACGVRPTGYRAPSFSIDERSLWAFDVLADKGFQYDSSVYPVRHPRYGMPSFVRVPRRVRTKKGEVLREFPLTTLRVLGRNVGASGGGYLRVFPLGVLTTAFRKMNRSGQPAVLYVHPWEIDPEQPRLSVGGLGRFTHYRNLARTESRIRALLAEFSFGTMEEALREAPDLGADPVEVG